MNESNLPLPLNSDQTSEPDDRFAIQLAQIHQAIVDGQRFMTGDGHEEPLASQVANAEFNTDPILAISKENSIQPLGWLMDLIEQVRQNSPELFEGQELPPIEPGQSEPDSPGEIVRETSETVDINLLNTSRIDQQAAPLITTADGATDSESRTSRQVELGRFKLLFPLGKGGFGVVYAAEDRHLKRRVAIKMPRPEAMLSPSLRQRFIREGRAAASLSHPNIVTVFETGQQGPICYLASELIDGTNLVEWRSKNPFIPIAIARLMSQVAEAIQHAHCRGALHRDLKPANILMSGDTPRVTDFGLAIQLEELSELSTAEAIVGTPAFMAPEQAVGRRDQIDVRTDVYGLGTILYFLLTGQPPFHSNTALEAIDAVRHREPIPPIKLNPQVPLDLQSICLKCLEKDAGRRYGSAHQLYLDLERFLSDLPVHARPITPTQRLVRWARRNRELALVSMAALIFLLISLMATTIGWYSTTSALKREQLANQTSAKRLIQLQEKSQELTKAIERLFVGLATSPEVQRESAEGLRRTLLSEANEYYQTFVSQRPSDDELRLEYTRTLFHLAEINAALGDLKNAASLAREVIDQSQPLPAAMVPASDRIEWQTFLARILFRCGRFDEARIEFDNVQQQIDELGETAVQELLPQRAALLTSRADHLLIEGKFAEAYELANEAAGLWQTYLEINEVDAAVHNLSKDSETILGVPDTTGNGRRNSILSER